ncbi:MAG: replicative DNA helicase [Calothrix sp. FI2-JRJ7]|jgi:replicative DNA helicase|nr:replicative DNA helicase [Calothrix sp. FI2-JRJ7]
MSEELNFQNSSVDRLPPQIIEAEEAVLGGILLDPEAISRVSDRLQPEAFYISAHKEIYQATLSLHRQGKPTDLLSVTSWLSDHDLLARVGGRNKLASLIESTVSAVNIDALAQLITDKYQRRRLIKAGNEIVQLGYETETDISKVIDQAEQKVFNIAQDRSNSGLVHISDSLISNFKDIENRNQGIALPGISSGYYDLDAMINGGFQRSDLVIIAGRPAMGKCVAYDTEILLADGSISSIEEIYHRQKANLITLGDNWKFKVAQPSAYVDDGHKPVFRVTTRLGRYVETTITHPYLTINGWRPLSELKVGDKVAVPRKYNVFGTETITDSEVKSLVDFINGGAETIPPIIFKLTRAQIALFLNRLFANNGWPSSGQAQLGYCSVNEKLARQIQHLLLRFGIIAALKRKSVKYQETRREAWQLDVIDANSIKTFASEIGIFGKQKAISNIELANNDVYWDEIVSIEPMGEKQVYDLTISETHNFVANDICVHNTSFSINIAHYIAGSMRMPVAIFSLEMSKEQLALRMLSSEARIESTYLRSGRISQNQWEDLTRGISLLQDMPIYIDDTPGITVTEMRSQARRLQAEAGADLGLILIDYLQLMEGAGDNRVQELSKITRNIKGLARELNVPVIALSQLSRGVESRTNKRPMLSDLRESGSIEQDADLVMMLYRDEYYSSDTPERGLAEVIVAKHRHGPTGTIKLLFDPQFTQFKNLARGSY